MPRGSSNELFALVKSLSKSEKRYFKLFVSIYSPSEASRYVKLFNIMDKQSTYSEQEFMAALGESNKRVFSKLKGYLFEHILKCLCMIDRKSSLEMEVRMLLDEADILRLKSLHKSARKKLEAAAKLAKENEMFLYELIARDKVYILDHEERNISKLIRIEKSENTERMIVVEKYLDFRFYKNLELKMYIVGQKGGYEGNIKLIKILEEMLRFAHNKGFKKPISDRAQRVFDHLMATYYYLICDFETCSKYIEGMLKYEQRTLGRSNNSLMNYVNVLQFKLIIYTHLDDHKKFYDTLDVMKRISKNYRGIIFEGIEQAIFEESRMMELIYSIHNCYYQNALLIADEVIGVIKNKEKSFNQVALLLFYYKFSVLYFILGDYQLSLKYLNKVLNYRDKSLHEILFVFSRVLNIILHFEMGNLSYVNDYVKTTYNFLVRKKQLTQIEKCVLSFFGKITNLQENAEVTIFNDFKEEISLLSSKIDKTIFIEYYPIIMWVEAKLQNKPLKEILIKNKKAWIHSNN